MDLRTVLRLLVARRVPEVGEADAEPERIPVRVAQRERGERLPPAVSEWIRQGADPSCRRLAVAAWRRRTADMDDDQLTRRMATLRQTLAGFRGQRSQPLAGHLQAELEILDFETAQRTGSVVPSRRSLPGQMVAR